MFGTPASPYADGMERITPVANLLTLAPSTTPRPLDVARTCGTLTVRCLKARLPAYIVAGKTYLYWIWMGPLPRRTRTPR